MAKYGPGLTSRIILMTTQDISWYVSLTLELLYLSPSNKPPQAAGTDEANQLASIETLQREQLIFLHGQ